MMKFNISNNQNRVLLEISENDNNSNYTSNIEDALSQAKQDIKLLDETIESIKALKPDCDKIDYALAASSGALCGILDIFLIGKPDESPLGEITDKWFADKTTGFATFCGWKPVKEAKLENAISFLESKFKIPYDQTRLGEAAKSVFGLDTDTSRHHFESLAHNPSILGLFFSILDQFTNESHFVIDGQLISLIEADKQFKLKGSNFVSKLFCGIINWFGHLTSDMSGSYKSAAKGNRGMGIPSPLWTWVNDIIVIKRKLGIPESEFDKSMNQMAIDVFKEGFDIRFQTAQTIPVLINELIVRVFYAVRRMCHYYSNTPKEYRSIKQMWQLCKPFGNPTISRMLTVAHGTFCLVDVADATIRSFVAGGGNFNPIEFFLRLNLAGVGRLTISLYGETKREYSYRKAQKEAEFAQKTKIILENYIDGLNILKELYDDQEYLSFIDDLNKSKYITAFIKTGKIANLRGVPQDKILNNKESIDNYFSTNKK
ncbi:MAG: hypothetical protein K2I11_03605 [Bacteroides sp.]|nr:hypothetical protein [Bacteroides sp.]